MPSNTKRAHEIGYGRPPIHTRFKKGQSGNPNGRPKTPRSIGAKIKRELDKLITITQEGKRFTVTRRVAVKLQLIKSAVGGNPRSMEVLLKEIRALEPKKRGREIIIKYYKDRP